MPIELFFNNKIDQGNLGTSMCTLLPFCSIDATSSKRVGRFANDEWRCPNAYVKKVFLGEIPKLLVFSKKKITEGEEIRFDYGQKDAPWRCKVRRTI